MLGQSSHGSILALLKKNGWGLALTCGIGESYASFSHFEIEITLTPQGRAKVVRIIEVVLQAIKLIKEEGVTEQYFEEVSDQECAKERSKPCCGCKGLPT